MKAKFASHLFYSLSAVFVFCCVAILYLLPNLYAQNNEQETIYSLIKKLAKSKKDTNKVLLLGKLSEVYSTSQPDTAIKYATEQLVLATKLEWIRGIAYANSSFGANYYSKNDLLRSTEYYNKAIEIWLQQEDRKMLADNYAKAGDIYFLQGDHPAALDYLLKACNLYEDIGDKVNAAKTTARIGDIYCSQKDGRKAMEYLQKALQLYQGLNDKLALGRVNASIGNVRLGKQDYSGALAYFNKALAIFEQSDKPYEISNVYGNIGSAYIGLKEYSKALAFYFKAMNLSRSVGNKYGEEAAVGYIGEAYLDMAKDQYLVLKPDSLVPANKNVLLQKAVEYLLAGIVLSNETRNQTALAEFYPKLSEAYAMQGLYKSALDYHLLYSLVKDSLSSTERKIRLFNVQAQHDLELKNKQIELEKLAVEKKQNERIFYIAGIAGLLIVIVFIAMERRKSDNLLRNILPESVATELKSKGSTEVTYFDNVTVLFTDFVGFTRAGEHMTPRELINELHNCFEAFDKIMGKYNIEKIKTIGDAYLAVAGLPKADPKHAENVVMAALEICDFMRERKKQLGDRTFGVRVGVNSGSVVAGIVGSKKFAYDIWGDAVNTAARMEQNSMVDKVNISQTTYELIKNKFTVTARGDIAVKNKGVMRMYFVEKIMA